MKQGAVSSNRHDALRAILNCDVAERVLCGDAGIDWPGGTFPTDLRIERAWPTREGGFHAEWSFRLGARARYSLVCASQSEPIPAEVPVESKPIVTPGGLRRLSIHIPAMGMLLHTPDRDPDMPHLAQCLDGGEMAHLLVKYIHGNGMSGDGRALKVDCRPVGYRAGRRAAVAYRITAEDGSESRLLGKVYRDGRGKRLLQRHAELDAQLARVSRGRVRTPAPLGYLSENKMALVAWHNGHNPKTNKASPSDETVKAVDALRVLHSVEMEGLNEYGADDELAIVTRWHSALERVDADLARTALPLLSAAGRARRFANANRRCTIHRDFYERQLLSSGEVTTILDLDTLAFGPPCVDVGNLLAHVALSTLSAGGSTYDACSLAKTAVNRYIERGGSLNRKDLAFYWSSALFRVGAIHALRSASKAHVPSLWGLAARLLGCVGELETNVSGCGGWDVGASDRDPILGAVDS